MAVNDMIMHFPHIDYAYSNSRDELFFWSKCRRKDLNQNFTTHTREESKGSCPVDRLHDLPGGGTSGLNAVLLGLEMGYTDILLAGMPLDNSGHYFNDAESNFLNEVPERDGGLRYWNSHDLKYVKSLSGRTKDLLT